MQSKRIIAIPGRPKIKTLTVVKGRDLPKFIVHWKDLDGLDHFASVSTSKEATAIARQLIGAVYVGHLSYAGPFNTEEEVQAEVEEGYIYQVRRPNLPVINFDTYDEADIFCDINRPSNLYRQHRLSNEVNLIMRYGERAPR